jgi:hypothetical protein
MVFRVVTPYRLVDGGTSSFKIVPWAFESLYIRARAHTVRVL